MGANDILVTPPNVKQQKGSVMAINVGTNTQQSNREAVGWGWTTQGKRAVDNTTRGERPTRARRLGGGQHKDDRQGAEDMMQGNWAADGTTRGGGGVNAHGWLSRRVHNNQQTMVVERGGQWQGDGQEQRASALAVARSGPLAVGEDGWQGVIGIRVHWLIGRLHEIANVSATSHKIADVSVTSHKIVDVSATLLISTYCKVFIIATVQVRKVAWKILFKRCRTFISFVLLKKKIPELKSCQTCFFQVRILFFSLPYNSLAGSYLKFFREQVAN